MTTSSTAASAIPAAHLPAALNDTDPAARILAAARLILPDLEQGRRIDAAMLRKAMETAFGASDASGAWDWKTAYEACEAATVLFLRKFGPAIRAKAASPTAMLPMLGKLAGLLPPLRGEPDVPAVLDTDRIGARGERCRRNHTGRPRP